MSKWRSLPKSKPAKSSVNQPSALKQGKSFKAQNFAYQPAKAAPMSATKSVLNSAPSEMHGQSQHAAFYMKDYSEEQQ